MGLRPMSDQGLILIALFYGSPVSTKTVADNAMDPYSIGRPGMAMPLGERPVFACTALRHLCRLRPDGTRDDAAVHLQQPEFVATDA